MSYDLRLLVKAEGTDCYVQVDTPEYDSPTYNLGEMFRACMDWDFEQSKEYPCDMVLDKVERGIRELTVNRKEYEQYNPPNGWGNIDSALRALEPLRECIYDFLQWHEGFPINCLYMSW